ncbi:hypothetical protein A3709_12095 [Halioglobus sp. HI00S01]|uniref:hypothetical protein n=1 Tax=Halioglobus sp. HI00S01 TaxID=1822214 RepID=UPI0007C2AC96|nr:hypothetical protein [Halioglobus sp. HI00S01]KZX60325.1 hypothetical protein A3709_12095 [Halioglobus sp. HI00S01]
MSATDTAIGDHGKYRLAKAIGAVSPVVLAVVAVPMLVDGLPNDSRHPEAEARVHGVAMRAIFTG